MIERFDRSSIPRWFVRRTVGTLVCVVIALFVQQGHAQSDVRAWSADGQVFVIWRVDSNAPLTYDVYRSTAPVLSVSQATLVGRSIEPEWEGLRLKLVSQTATWRIPTAGGGTYQLAANEGLFVHTPRAGATEYFAVVRNGSTAAECDTGGGPACHPCCHACLP